MWVIQDLLVKSTTHVQPGSPESMRALVINDLADVRRSMIFNCEWVCPGPASWGVEIQAPRKTAIVTIFSTYPLSSTAAQSTRSGGFRGCNQRIGKSNSLPARLYGRLAAGGG